MIPAVVFVFGLIIGSFLNVCIWRLPRGESIVYPGSRCPACQAPIKPYDNIPVVSYLALRGRCRSCAAPIPLQYPLVELLTGVLFLACYLRFGRTMEAIKWAAFSSLVVVLVFTDARERILPDAINFSGLGLGLVLSLWTPVRDGTASWLAAQVSDAALPSHVLSLADALLGTLFGGGILWIIAEAYFRLRGHEGLGLGDVKMMAMIGAFFGLKKTFLTLLLGSIIGSLLGIVVVGFLFFAGSGRDVAERGHRRGLGNVRKLHFALVSKYQLPFGTYLGMAALAVLFLGPSLVDWYRSVVGFR